jgi:ankyrin repeat protein
MATVDDLIDLADDGDEQGALDLLSSREELATGESQRQGVLAGATPLHWAAHRDHVRLCTRLLEPGADVNAHRAQWWRTPLARAADAGCVAAVGLLLDRGADVDQDSFGMTSALHAVAQGGSTNGRRDPEAYATVAERLIAAGANIDRRATGDGGQTPLGDAERRGNTAVADVLRRHGAEAVGYQR